MTTVAGQQHDHWNLQAGQQHRITGICNVIFSLLVSMISSAMSPVAGQQH